MKNTKQKIGIGAACCLMILSGTILSGTVFAQSDDTASAVSNKTTAQTSVKTDTITTEEANTIALKKTNGGEVKESKLDRDDQVLKYEIKIMNGDTEYEVDINASTGKILKYESEKIATQQTNTQSQTTTTDTTKSNSKNQATQNTQATTTESNNNQQTNTNNTNNQTTANNTQQITNQTTTNTQVITADKAQSIALSASGGGTVVKCEYDVEEQEYEIEILNGTMEHDIDINAYSGAIISHDKEVEDFD
jgi:uncharacterized membrane protein YkoI